MFLGVDIGSVSLKLALLDENGGVRFSHWVRTCGRPRQALEQALAALRTATGVGEFQAVCVTGSGKGLLGRHGQLLTLNEILAHAAAVRRLEPGARTVIEIGGQDSKLIRLDERGEISAHAFNDICAAGTGAFLDQQAERLGLGIDRFANMAAGAKDAVSIASRCAVFAKSDMIHHQQQGASPQSIAWGLCLALARNYLSQMLRGARPELPLVFCGGVARNAGVRRAFCELLELRPEDWRLPEHSAVMGAIGAALWAGENGRSGRPLSLERLLELNLSQGRTALSLPALRVPRELETAPAVGNPQGGVFLGVDIGSVSSKVAAIDVRGRLVAGEYTLTAGRPLEALGRVLQKIAQRLPRGVEILGCATTGSGRRLAQAACGADRSYDEISAQLRAARECDPEVDTVIEIGGQDAKVILLENGRLADFALNRVCAAGTGSFLAEQAARLGVTQQEAFGEMALESPAPTDLGCRCTVFMDSDLIHHQQRGSHLPDLLAGLAVSVAKNFLEHVVEGRRLGKRVIFQGGVASHLAVRAAFESLLGVPVKVHPWHRISGAMGAALLAREEIGEKAKSRFVGLQNYDPQARSHSFACRGCQNRCEVIRVDLSGGQRVFFGGGCDRYEQPAQRKDIRHRLRFFSESEELQQEVFQNQPSGLRERFGYPRALWNIPLAAFWVGFFNRLGVKLESGPPSNRQLYRSWLAAANTEQCFAAKLAVCQVAALCRPEVDRIFLPAYLGLPRSAEEASRDQRSFSCPYVQTMPDVCRASLPNARWLTPKVDLSLGPSAQAVAQLWEQMGREFGWSRRQLAEALQAGWTLLARLRARLRELGRRALAEAGEGPTVVLFGRPYQLYDPLLRFSLPVRLAQAGATVIPYDILPSEGSLGPEWSRLYWRANRDQLAVMKWLAAHPRLLPVVITAFGCGPDAFATRYLREQRRGKPLLLLELDEHTAEAGLSTRVEAFLNNAVTAFSPAPNPPATSVSFRMFLPPRPEEKSLRGRTLYIPRVLDHMVVFKAALEREGYAVELLPPTSREALERGRAWSSGRECNPFAYILGDLIALTRRPDFRPEKSAFFINSTVGPCLLSQFARGFELAMHELGWEGMLVDDPPGEAFKRRFRLPTLVRLWEGLVAVEVLGRLLAEYRPSEKSLGAADAVHQENLRDLENAVRRGQVAGSLIRARERLQAVCGPPDTERPLIAVVGDIFTRVNPVANARLHQRIEALGCRVLPPPTFTDTAWHDAGEDLLNHLRQGKTLKAVEDALLAALQFAVAERLQRGARLDGAKLPLRDWSWWKVDKKLSGLLTHEVDSILAMNVALALDAATQGAAAVINAICHNCMIGTVSAAVLQRCARKAGMPPMVTLAFDGLQETNTDTRLEALCQRALWSRRKGKVHE